MKRRCKSIFSSTSIISSMLTIILLLAVPAKNLQNSFQNNNYSSTLSSSSSSSSSWSNNIIKACATTQLISNIQISSISDEGPSSTHNHQHHCNNRSSSWQPGPIIRRLYKQTTEKAQNLYNKYSDQMDNRPVFTQCVTTSIFSFISDIISQTLEARAIGGIVPIRFDFVRFTSFTIVGFIYDGPFFHYWYDLMWKFDDYLQIQKGFSKFAGTSAQVFVDQTIGSLIYFPIYFYMYDIIEAFLSGKIPCLAITRNKVRKELFSVIFVSYLVFPLSNFLNFYFIPKQFRIMFLNIVDMFFSAYQCSKVA